MPIRTINIPIIGPPNVGKTTLFNLLTHKQETVMNYPGATIACHSAELTGNNNEIWNIVDTPGIHSLGNSIPEEKVVHNILFEDKNPPTKVILVLDDKYLNESLILLEQLMQSGHQVVVYINHLEHGHSIDLKKLSQIYKTPFISNQSSKSKEALLYALNHIPSAHSAQYKEWTTQEYTAYYHRIKNNLKKVRENLILPRRRPTLGFLDKLAFHPLMGLGILLGCLFFLFCSIFFIAQPISEGIDDLLNFAIVAMENKLTPVHPLIGAFIAGSLRGLGTLVVFIPQVFLLFIAIGLIQESGYLARAAVLFDSVLSKVGLHGKSFVSMLTGFACAIPAILLTRTIDSKKERLLTILIMPLMLCSARVPVYSLLISLIFFHQSAWMAGAAFGVMYLMSLVLGALASGIINKFVKSSLPSFLMLELPAYKIPSFSSLLKNAAKKSYMFIQNAGPIIILVSTVLWGLSTFPKYDLPSHERLQESYMARIGKSIEPVFTPMGADWRVGTAILSSFAAREIFVPTLKILLDQNTDHPQRLTTILKSAKKIDGTPLFTGAALWALLVFFMIALQCSSTIIVTAKELRSWPIALAQLIVYNMIAYIMAIIVYHIL